MRLHALGALLAVALLAPSAAMSIEKPAYRVVERRDGWEIRQYEPYLVAQTVVEATRDEAGNEGFRRLAGYIFGKNAGARKLAMTSPVAQAAEPAARPAPAKIAMTAPVAMRAEAGGPGRFVIQFMMPKGLTLQGLPEPLDARVTFAEVPARRVAALAYSGTWSTERYERHLGLLRAGLEEAGLAPLGEPVWARYDPPFMPWFLRTNEILLELAPAPAAP
jgi:hypothetical protein